MRAIGAAALSAFGALLVLIAAAYLWVAVYSYVLEPGHEFGFYEQYAQTASPVVGVFAGLPVFWILGRQLGARFGVAAPIAAWGIFAATGVAISLAAGAGLLMCAIDLPLKLAMTWWGARVARA